MSTLRKLLSSLFPAPYIIEDAFFGTLRFMPTKRNVAGYWEGKRIFTTTDSMVETFVDAEGWQTPPTTAQQDFFTEVEGKYASMVPALQAALDEYVHKYNITGIPTRMEEIKPSALDVRLTDNMAWNFYFESEDENHYVFNMNGWNVEGVTVNG